MSESDSLSDDGSKNKRRKNNSSKSDAIKQAKVQGKEHVSYGGNLVPERKTGPHCRCPRKCYELVGEEYQMKILSHMNCYTDKNTQDEYLQGLIDVKPLKRERKSDTTNPKVRMANFNYHVNIDGKQTQVCKKAFLGLHGIGEKHVRRLNHLLVLDSAPVDMRGKMEGSRHNVISGEICNIIKIHIESFPVHEVHYSNNLKRKYLSAKLDVKQMHELFKKQYPDVNVNYKFYLKYFKENFDFKFGKPQIDVCSACEELTQKIKSPHLNDNARRVAEAELQVHKRRAKKFYNKIDEIKKLSQEKNSVLGITIDYMQNIPLPDIPVQEVFYYRQLWVYEFCIVNLKDNNATFFSYHEGQALKGPNEVCSFLNTYFQKNIPEEVKELHIFSDGCPGQNKNNTMIRFLLATSACGRFEKIYQYFPIRGHSFLPCDRAFATAKRLIRKSDRIYTPEEINILIKKASANFEVIQVATNEIIDFKAWWPSHYKKTVLSRKSHAKNVPREQKISLQVSKYMMYEYCSREPDLLKAYSWIDGLHTEDFLLGKAVGCRPELPETRAYNGQIPINEKKIADIRKLIQYIPAEKLDFYNELLEWPTKEQNQQEDF